MKLTNEQIDKAIKYAEFLKHCFSCECEDLESVKTILTALEMAKSNFVTVNIKEKLK